VNVIDARLWRVAAPAILAVSLAPRAAHGDASPDSYRLVWVRGERTESCEDAPSIARRVSSRLGREVFTSTAPRSIEGVIQHEGAHWEAHLYVRDDKGALAGSRIIDHDGPDCGSLDSAVVLAIALTIDPEAAIRPESSTAAGTVSPPPLTPDLVPPKAAVPPPAEGRVCPPAPPPPPPPPCPTQQPCPPAPFGAGAPPHVESVAVTLRALFSGGLLPGVTPGVSLAVDLPVYRALHATSGVFFLPEESTSSGQFAFGLTAAWIGPCLLPLRRPRASLAACAKLDLGAIHSVVKKLIPLEPGDRLWAGGSLSVEGRLRVLGPLVAEAGGELVLPIPEQQFSIQSQQGSSSSLYSESPVAGVGFLALGVSIP
jgi:hypothetical protein